MKFLVIFLVGFVVVVNVVGFVMMGVDKSRARRGAWRISEASLFLVAAIGGSLGCIAGMQVFRHKTKHWYFKFGFPTLLILQLALGGWLIWRFAV